MTHLPALFFFALAAAAPLPSRLEQLVEANILGTHAFQVALAKKEGKGDPACYSPGALTDAQLATLETHQAALMKADVTAVRRWAEGKPSAFDPKIDLEPLLASGLLLADALPVDVFTRWLSEHAMAPRVQVRSLASLFQTNLEVERDGDRLQELFAFYAGLGLPVYLGQLGPAGDGCRLPRHGPRARGEKLRLAGRHERRRVADRRAQELELGREEPGDSRRQGPGPRAARRARRGGSRPEDPRPADAADRRDRPLLHDAAALVDARGLRAGRDRDLRPREPEGGVPAVPGGRSHLDESREPLLRRRRGLEAAAGPARGHQPHGRGPPELRASRTRPRRGGSEGPHVRRRARPQGHGHGPARQGDSPSPARPA